ncbi:N-acetylneuraminate synthase family protein [Desulfosarcina ovata]|uniref:N-acetylneuraminate synthase n=1 Tax=Desulfosarcina ovata subsp. ovata TaxID=2752305 RepID=A0A5K8A6T8_9BACT|nr:N-acetylneuraminate synthase family protein [Desulfosarcina ovata]BBO88343.1 N-acetylneuraminate synthase [Desulfosarcina ovata subsp. ovata]
MIRTIMPETNYIKIGSRIIGNDQPTFIVAEIGINHNGDLDIARQLIDIAVSAGCDAVKFQKRSPDVCVPPQQKCLQRETPWGVMSYIDYRHRVEFGRVEYGEIDRYCKKKKIPWLASCWDIESIDFMDAYSLPAYKVASACLTDEALLYYLKKKNKPVVLSTGMSSMSQIRRAVGFFEEEKLLILHTTSSYQFNPGEINLRVIDAFRREFRCPIGYSGHEIGFAVTLAAVALGAVIIERHITLDRSMWGSDHSISLDPPQLRQMVRDIRIIEKAMGDGVKQIYESERRASAKLRNCKAV